MVQQPRAGLVGHIPGQHDPGRSCRRQQIDGRVDGTPVVACSAGNDQPQLGMIVGQLSERRHQPRQVLAAFQRGHSHDELTVLQFGNGALGRRSGQGNRSQRHRTNGGLRYQLAQRVGRGDRTGVGHCPVAKRPQQHLAGANHVGMRVMGMTQEPAVVHRHQPWQPAGRYHVVGAMDDVGGIAVHSIGGQPPIDAGVVGMRPQPMRQRGRQRQPAHTVGRTGAETGEVGHDRDVVAVRQRRLQRSDCGTDAGSWADEWADVERNGRGDHG